MYKINYKLSSILLLLLTFGLTLVTCSSPTQPPAGTGIMLVTEDVSSVEAWIRLTTNNLQLPATVTLKQSATGGNSVTQDIILS